MELPGQYAKKESGEMKHAKQNRQRNLKRTGMLLTLALSTLAVMGTASAEIIENGDTVTLHNVGIVKGTGHANGWLTDFDRPDKNLKIIWDSWTASGSPIRSSYGTVTVNAKSLTLESSYDIETGDGKQWTNKGIFAAQSPNASSPAVINVHVTEGINLTTGHFPIFTDPGSISITGFKTLNATATGLIKDSGYVVRNVQTKDGESTIQIVGQDDSVINLISQKSGTPTKHVSVVEDSSTKGMLIKGGRVTVNKIEHEEVPLIHTARNYTEGHIDIEGNQAVTIGSSQEDYAIQGYSQNGGASTIDINKNARGVVTINGKVTADSGTVNIHYAGAGSRQNGDAASSTVANNANHGSLNLHFTGEQSGMTGNLSAAGSSSAKVSLAGQNTFLTGNMATSDQSTLTVETGGSNAAIQGDLDNQGGTANITLQDTSIWTGKAEKADAVTTAASAVTNVALNGTALWNMTASSRITNLTGSGGTVWFQNGGDALETDSVSGSHTWAVDLDYDTPANSDMIYIANGTSDEQTLNVKNIGTVNAQMPDGAKVRFATVKNAGGGFIEGKSYYAPNGIYNDALTVHYVDRATDTETKNYDGDGTDESRKPSQETVEEMYGGQNVYLVKKEKAELNEGALTPLRSEELVWRYMTDLDTFTNRTGESQYFTPGAGQGGWIRYKYRNLGVDGVGEVDGSTYELGYTAVTRQDAERKHRLGASVAYGKDTGRWEGYSGDLKLRDLAVSLYDTHEYFPGKEKMAGKPAWKDGTHTYWDNYLKYHHVRTDYDAYDPGSGADYDGEYSQDVVKFSTEYGRENKLSAKWSWVPQAQLQLAYLSSYDYTDSRGLAISAEHDWSLISRAGFDLVNYLDAKKESKLYLKASVLHEFFDGNDVTTSSDNGRYTSKGDQSGTWGVFGLGYSVRSSKNQYLYFDAERYVGNDFKRTYNLRAGLNWKF